MADDITQRRMDAEEEANLIIGSQDFQHTISGQDQSGLDVHRDLLERAAERQHLIETVGEGSQFLDYKRSQVGGIGKDRELHRQLILLSRKEREKREMRFGHKRPVPTRHKNNSPNKRQGFNAMRSAEADNATGDSPSRWQESNSEGMRGGPNISFREPQPRGYDPFK